MKENKTMFVITNCDFQKGLGDSTLLIRRARALFYQKNIKSLFFCLKSIPEHIEHYEFASFSSIETINDFVASLNESVDYVLVYGGALYFKIKKLLKARKQYGFKLLLDVQGCLEEMIDFTKNPIQFLKYFLKKIAFKKVLSYVDGCFVTSSKLIDYCQKYSKKKKLNYYLVRCGIDDIRSFNLWLNERNEIRNKFGISNKNVLVYSGSLHPWQRFFDILDIFSKYSLIDEDSFFIIMSKVDEKTLSTIQEKLPNNNYVIIFADQNEYSKILGACDIGFLLRDYKMTNMVAFPNKFSDYLESRLIVSTNQAIPEIIDIMSKNQIVFFNPETDDLSKLKLMIDKKKNNLKEYNDLIIDVCKKLSYEEQVAKLDI